MRVVKKKNEISLLTKYVKDHFKDFWKQKLHGNHWHKLLLIHTSHVIFIFIYTWYYVSWFIKEKVCVPKTLQILCILCSTSMTHTATIPQGIPAPFCALCFEDQCRKHEKKPLFPPSTCHYFKREQVANTYITITFLTFPACF